MTGLAIEDGILLLASGGSDPFEPPLSDVITPHELQSVGSELRAIGLVSGTSNAWPTANLAFYVPFTISRQRTAKRLFIANGSTVSGNLDLGIYDEAGSRVVSAGSTAQSGANDLQIISISDTVLAAGRYYIAVVMDNTTGTIMRVSPNNVDLQAFGIRTEASAFPLPATATMALPSSSNLPLHFGAAFRTVI